MIRIIRVVLATILVAWASGTTASIIPATDSGWYAETIDRIPGNTNYITGFFGPAFPAREFHNFFVFDLTGVGPVSNATLRAYLSGDPIEPGYRSPDPYEIWGLFDVTTNLSVLMGGTGGVNAFYDLGSGVVFGQTNVSADDMGSFVEVSLNAFALASINAAGGLWAVGGALLSPGGADLESIFASSRDDFDEARVELVVTSAIPAPTTVYLFSSALLALCYSRRGRRFDAAPHGQGG